MTNINSQKKMTSRERFLRACRGQPVDRPPVWMMRQAGRTLPEYLEIRKKHTFWEICRTPELAAEVTVQPVQRFPVDAAIIFSDILTIPASLGLDVSFSNGITISPVVRTEADLNRLHWPDMATELDFVGKAIEHTRRKVGSDFPVLGFSGAPYTLACYMAQGSGAKYFHRIKALMYSQPDVFHRLMEKLSLAVATYLEMQIQASADAVQLFDSWAGDLSPDNFRTFVLPHLKTLIERIRETGVPVIYFVNGIGNLLEPVRESGADVISVDWRIPLAAARGRLGSGYPVQGNLDPAALFDSPENIRTRVFSMLNESGGTGHIVNLGHGLMPDTPISGIRTFVTSVAEWAGQRHAG